MLFSKNKIRLRFAPSPTGFLHLGNLRSALFGYLLAKSWKGKFILRLEDTDQKREVEGSLEKLLDILSWVGIKFSEGPHTTGKYGPYIQSERLAIYKKFADQLLAEKKAYRCFCTSERLTDMRLAQEAAKKAPRYDRLCRSLSEEEIKEKLESGAKFVIRQRLPRHGEIVVYDELRGQIKFAAKDLDDHILIKSDGVPTYHFASVVDDHLMKISHVTRGDEWLPSFPKNVLLYQAFGWTPPKFIHLPLILNKTGGKLSKRQGDVFVENYRDQGYLPEALVNFCALLGWHPKGDQEILKLCELEKIFSLKGLGVSPAIFDLEKLDYFNGYYLRQKNIHELTTLARPFLIDKLPPITDDQLEKFVGLAQERLKKLVDIPDLISFLWDQPKYEIELLRWKNISLEETRQNLQTIEKQLISIEAADWHKEKLENHLLAWLKSNNKKNGDYLWPLRVALTGLKNSPGPMEVASALGKDESLKRIQAAIKLLS